MKALTDEVEALVARVGTHPVWGYHHCLRVHALAEELAKSERLTYDPEILRIAALLHDVGLYKAYAFREAPAHARRPSVSIPAPERAARSPTDRHPPPRSRSRTSVSTSSSRTPLT